MALIDHIDPVTRRIHLSFESMNTAWHPVELYREVRALRAADPSLRKYDNFMKGDGNIDKGGGKATERYFTLLLGTRIVPWDAAHIVDVTGTLITDDGFEGAFCFDKSTLTPGVAVDIQYAPKQVEVINLNFDDLVFASFLGGVWYQASSPYGDVGSDNFPNGNRERPVNNVQLATQIAVERGFDTIFILGNMTLTTGDNVDSFTLIGQNPTKNILTIEDGASTIGSEFKLVTISGVLDGGTVLRECLITTVNYFNGFLVDCVLAAGTITLGGGASALLLNCVSGVPGADTPMIDMGGTGQSLGMRNYNGGIKITNKTGTDAVSLDMNSGQVIVDSTVTNTENFYVRGVARLTDNSTGTAKIDSVGLLSGERTVRGAGYVAVDPSGYAGTDSRTGTESFPSNNIADAITIAKIHDVNRIHVHGMLSTVGTEDLTGFTVSGESAVVSMLTVAAGTTTTNTTFRELNLIGTLSGDGTIIERCQVGNLAGVKNYMYNCFIYGTVGLTGNTTVALCAIAPTAVTQKAYFDFNNLASTLIISDWGAGVAVFKNMITGSFGGASGTGGRIELDVSNIGGNVVYGGSLLINPVNLDTVDDIKDSSVAGAVWGVATRDLSVQTGLTVEEHDHLLSTATAADTIVASQL